MLYDCWNDAKSLGLVGLAEAFKLALGWQDTGASVADIRLRAERCALSAVRAGDLATAQVWDKVSCELATSVSR